MLGNGARLNMTNNIDRDNEDWLLGLAGEPRPDADTYTNTQAAAVRIALARRAAELDEEAPEASDAGYHRLLFRLKREGHIGPEAENRLANKQAAANDSPSSHVRTGTYDLPPAMRSANSGAPTTRHDTSSIQSKKTWWNPALGMAAVFLLGAIVVFHSYQINEESEEVLYKGSSGQSIVRVKDPEATTAAIANTLKSQHIEFQLFDLPRGTKQLIAPISAETLGILSEYKIQVKPDEPRIDILFERKK